MDWMIVHHDDNDEDDDDEDNWTLTTNLSHALIHTYTYRNVQLHIDYCNAIFIDETNKKK